MKLVPMARELETASASPIYLSATIEAGQERTEIHRPAAVYVEEMGVKVIDSGREGRPFTAT